MEESPYVSRRQFIGTTAWGLMSALSAWPVLADADTDAELTILHTNDVHSRIDPFEKNHPLFPGQGGAARRSMLISKVRQERKNVLVLDSGDIFQGTPYFNLYHGEPEIKLMNLMGYHAATIGNHEFDAGLLNLSERVRQATFPFICSNYDFTGTPIESQTIPWKVEEFGRIRVGIIGLGIELEGLVDPKLFGTTRYQDPVEAAEKWGMFLKEKKNCHLVVALSHLGYSYQNTKVSDRVLAEKTSEIDIILGGHTHTFIDEPVTVLNKKGQKVLICQTGWGGVKLGRIDLQFHRKSPQKRFMISSM